MFNINLLFGLPDMEFIVNLNFIDIFDLSGKVKTQISIWISAMVNKYKITREGISYEDIDSTIREVEILFLEFYQIEAYIFNERW